MRTDNLIYELENHLKDGRMVEKIAPDRPMYDLRRMASTIKILGRQLTSEEVKSFMVLSKQ